MIESIYIHIPFCSNICSYCDFSKIFYNKDIVSKYLNSLELEIKNNYKNEKVKTIYIGGGTPSSLDIEELERLFQIISIFNKDKDYEFTIECNSENTTKEKIKLFKKYGVNRVSIGVQTFNEKVLKLLNRKHSNEQVFNLVKLFKDYGINNINIDLIFGINNQTISDIKMDLDNFIKLDIPHISYYSLILEDNTKLAIDNYKQIDDDMCASMYEYICNYLINNGYSHYEISNFSKIGYESLHNLTYWNNDRYYGFGLGSHGYVDDIRYQNTRSITKYLNGEYLLEKEKITRNIDIENEIILGLRKVNGINKTKFKNKFNNDIYEVYDLTSLIENKYLIDDGDNIFINNKYLFISNEILVNILNNLK